MALGVAHFRRFRPERLDFECRSGYLGLWLTRFTCRAVHGCVFSMRFPAAVPCVGTDGQQLPLPLTET